MVRNCNNRITRNKLLLGVQMSENKEQRLNQSLMDSFIDAYIKAHPGLTREQAAKELNEISMHHD
jgi:hypothetical protein